MKVRFIDYLDSLKNTSYDKTNNAYMVNNIHQVINFDQFQEAYFSQYKKPVTCSIDALKQHNREWFFIEFKNGKIDNKTKKNISEKVGHSLFSFLDVLNEKIDYCRKKVNFIFVYNKENNSQSGHRLSCDDYQLSIERQKLKSLLLGVKKYIPLFQMGRYEDVYFKNVYTYDQEQFEKFVNENFGD